MCACTGVQKVPYMETRLGEHGIVREHMAVQRKRRQPCTRDVCGLR